MAKKLDAEQINKLGDDFSENTDNKTTATQQAKPINNDTGTAAANTEEKPKKTRRKRITRERVQVSAYLSPAQYKIVSKLADDSGKNLSDAIRLIIDEYYEVQERRRIKNARKNQ